MLKFKYILRKGKISFPFRVGDIVKVKNWGETYDCPKFNEFFGVKNNETFYRWSCDSDEKRSKAKDFKIVKLGAHPNGAMVVAYIVDRQFRDNVIGLKGLSLVKQFPLRKNESTEIELELMPR